MSTLTISESLDASNSYFAKIPFFQNLFGINPEDFPEAIQKRFELKMDEFIAARCFKRFDDLQTFVWSQVFS